MKNQALFSSKDKSKKLKCCLLHFLFGPLRVNELSDPRGLENIICIICRISWKQGMHQRKLFSVY